MKNFILFATCFCLFLLTNMASAQETGIGHRCYLAKNRIAPKTTIDDTAENNYDVKYVKLNLVMTNTATTLSGDAITKATVLAPFLSQYVFELNNLLTIDSVLVNNTLCSFTTSADVRTATLSVELVHGTLFTAHVYYHGTPVSGSLYSSLGINTLTSPSWGARATFTLSESYHAKEWWPCKQSLQDKIDSSEVWITVADSLKAGSNGTLKAITTIDTNHVRYEWKETHPIDYYLISAAVSTYTDYSYYMHYTGSTDSTLVQNYVYNNPYTLPYFKSVIDSTGLMIDYFSQLYGRYPFWQEKYGHCMAPLSGGMEHQTMTTCGFFTGSLVAHELAHQWFGDNVTCKTWSDIFMNEGLASYSEDLFFDHFNSHAGMIADIASKQSDVLSYDTGTIYCPDTTENRVFDSRLSYNKGACVLNMLRFVVNNDSLFFAAYKTYQVQMKDSTGTILDFKNTFENLLGTTVNGINLDTFFNQWYYLQGYPKYTVSWNQIGTDVIVRLIQTGAVSASVPLFTIPIDLTLHSATIDTTVRILNNTANQVFHFTWANTMTNLLFDPNYWLLYKLNGAIIHDATLDANNLALSIPQDAIIYPNPTQTNWQISNIAENSILILYDITGKQILTENNKQSAATTIDAGQLPTGTYLLKIINANGSTQHYKLLKF